jgi:phage-related protein
LEKIRTIVAYKHYFEEFLVKQPVKVQNKIYKIFEIIEYQQFIPTRYLEHIKGTDGLYETKFSLGSDIWRVFCFFDEGRLVILLNGFQKKTQKTPKSEISIALRLKEEYFEEKKKGKT